MPDTSIKTRFAPSPTGALHVGNVRTALFNVLFAWAGDGGFLLRIEDTDQERSREEFVESLIEDLQWLGLEWREGPLRDGEHGPYRQSQRGFLYTRFFEELENCDLAYPCYCTPQELAVSRKAQLAAGRPPRYPGTCARLTEAERATRRKQGRAPTLRFRVPADEVVEFDDLVRGPQRFPCLEIGDFIVRRADGTPAFFFSNALDDALMGVTHVLRGEDHLTNTPRQLLLLSALELPAPCYGHISMILGDDGAPLSKRNGSRSVRELRAMGYLPQALLNYLARLGHYYSVEELMDLATLARRFELAHLGRAPARYDESQLLRWQKEALTRLSVDQLWEWANTGQEALGEAAILAQLVSNPARRAFMETIRNNILFPSDAQRWGQQLFGPEVKLSDEGRRVLHNAGVEFFKNAREVLAEHDGDFKDFARKVGRRVGVKGKALYLPLRVALTGELHGPEMERLFALLGRQRVADRLRRAHTLCTRGHS